MFSILAESRTGYSSSPAYYGTNNSCIESSLLTQGLCRLLEALQSYDQTSRLQKLSTPRWPQYRQSTRWNLINAPDHQFDIEPSREFHPADDEAQLTNGVPAEAQHLAESSACPPSIQRVNIVADHFSQPGAKFGVPDPGFRSLLSGCGEQEILESSCPALSTETGTRKDAHPISAKSAAHCFCTRA